MIDGASEVAGHPEIMPGTRWFDVNVDGIDIRTAISGNGPPLLLLHGHPQTHLTWHKVVGQLASRFTVIATDLRGYGDSSKPTGPADHSAYSKRAMSTDQVGLMHRLGFDRFKLVAHDRGARVAHRMALDQPDAVEKLVLLDIAPTATMYGCTDMEFARRYFWWFFLIQPFDLPERMIGADPDHFLDVHLAGQIKIAGSLDPRVVAEYRRCYRDPATRHAICEDYRASAGIDLIHDAEDGHKRVKPPLMALWGERGTIGALYDVLATWRKKADTVSGHAIDCGHSPQEEAPEPLMRALQDFL